MAVTDLLTLTAARVAISEPSTSTKYDGELASKYIPAVTILVEDIVGPVGRQQRQWQGSPPIILDTIAVVELVSASTPSGDPVDVTSWRVDGAGIVTAPGAPSRVLLTYLAGVCDSTDLVPANVALAAGVVLRHLWQTDHQAAASRPGVGGGSGPTVSTPSGFAVPARAVDLLRPAGLGFA